MHRFSLGERPDQRPKGSVRVEVDDGLEWRIIVSGLALVGGSPVSFCWIYLFMSPVEFSSGYSKCPSRGVSEFLKSGSMFLFPAVLIM